MPKRLAVLREQMVREAMPKPRNLAHIAFEVGDHKPIWPDRKLPPLAKREEEKAVGTVPTTLEELKAWIKANFIVREGWPTWHSYVDPNDFVPYPYASAFIPKLAMRVEHMTVSHTSRAGGPRTRYELERLYGAQLVHEVYRALDHYKTTVRIPSPTILMRQEFGFDYNDRDLEIWGRIGLPEMPKAYWLHGKTK